LRMMLTILFVWIYPIKLLFMECSLSIWTCTSMSDSMPKWINNKFTSYIVKKNDWYPFPMPFFCLRKCHSKYPKPT
jgi:hypothetical protein